MADPAHLAASVALRGGDGDVVDLEAVLFVAEIVELVALPVGHAI